jgi:hypothetical protein
MFNTSRFAKVTPRLRMVWRLALAGAVVTSFSTTLSAASLETAVLTAGGISNWGTYGSTAPFNSYFDDSVFIPTIGLAPAGIAGEIKSQTAASGLLTEQSSINTGFNTNARVTQPAPRRSLNQ